MRRAMGVVISGLRRSIWLSWSKSLYETSLRPCSSITSEYSRAGVRTSLNPKNLNRSLILPCTSSKRVDSGGSTSRVPGAVANFRGGSRSIREAILPDGRGPDGLVESARRQLDCCYFQNYCPFSAALQLAPAQVFNACRRETSPAEGLAAGYLLESS